MEPSPKISNRPSSTEQEVDLGHLFYSTSGALNRIVSGVARIFNRIGNAILEIIFFIRRNVAWLALGLLLGLGYGTYNIITIGARYSSELVVRANFNSTATLYGAINNFNALVANGRTEELSKVFNITPAEASSLIYFDGAPVESEIIAAELYDKMFLVNDPRSAVRKDTFWLRTLDYKDFQSSLTKYDYPIHRIKVTSTNPAIFPKLQQGIINYIISNPHLQESKTTVTETNKQILNSLSTSIESLDTLRRTYNKRLESGATLSGPKETNLTIVDGNSTSRIPELELYDKVLELNNELKIAKKQSVAENDIIQVYSSFSNFGQREGIFKQNITMYTIKGLLAALVILVSIAFYRYLTKAEKLYNERKKKKTSNSLS